MGDVLSPQSFGLRPPTGANDVYPQYGSFVSLPAEVTTDDNDVSLSDLERNDRSAVGRILAPSRRA